MTIFKVLKEFHDFLYEKKNQKVEQISIREVNLNIQKEKKNSDYYSLYLKIINSN